MVNVKSNVSVKIFRNSQIQRVLIPPSSVLQGNDHLFNSTNLWKSSLCTRSFGGHLAAEYHALRVGSSVRQGPACSVVDRFKFRFWNVNDRQTLRWEARSPLYWDRFLQVNSFCSFFALLRDPDVFRAFAPLKAQHTKQISSNILHAWIFAWRVLNIPKSKLKMWAYLLCWYVSARAGPMHSPRLHDALASKIEKISGRHWGRPAERHSPP